MNKQFLKEVFNPYFGFVYKWNGDIPTGQDPILWITEQFILSISDHDVNTTVVELSGDWVIYVNKEVVLDDPNFSLICDLSPDVYIEVIDPVNGEDSTQLPAGDHQ